MKKLLLLLISLLLSFNSYGDWTKTSEDTDGDSFYIDFQTIKKLDNGNVIFWGMIDNLEGNDGFMSSKIFWEGDCNLSRMKVLSLIQYEEPMGEGESESLGAGIVELDDIMPWRYLPPDTVGYMNLEEVCSLTKYYSNSDYEDKVLETITHYESFDWGDVDTTSDNVVTDEVEQADLDSINGKQAQYVRSIAEKVKSNWRYQGANDDWTAEVYILQDRNGNVLAVDVRNTNVGNSSRAKTFTDSIERAVRKSTPLPYTSDDAVFDKELVFVFSSNR
jgi:hypothetical protein